MRQIMGTRVNPAIPIQTIVRPDSRTRFQMQEDAQFVEGAILFFKDVQYDPVQMRLVYLPDSNSWTPQWAPRQTPMQNLRIQTPVLQPNVYMVNNKRKKFDLGQ